MEHLSKEIHIVFFSTCILGLHMYFWVYTVYCIYKSFTFVKAMTINTVKEWRRRRGAVGSASDS